MRIMCLYDERTINFIRHVFIIPVQHAPNLHSLVATSQSKIWRFEPFTHQIYIYICILHPSFRLKCDRWLPSFPMIDNYLPILNTQCHHPWWPGHRRSQNIWHHCTDLLIMTYAGFSSEKIYWTLANFCREKAFPGPEIDIDINTILTFRIDVKSTSIRGYLLGYGLLRVCVFRPCTLNTLPSYAMYHK